MIRLEAWVQNGLGFRVGVHDLWLKVKSFYSSGRSNEKSSLVDVKIGWASRRGKWE